MLTGPESAACSLLLRLPAASVEEGRQGSRHSVTGCRPSQINFTYFLLPYYHEAACVSADTFWKLLPGKELADAICQEQAFGVFD
jgi:hypothetical protein